MLIKIYTLTAQQTFADNFEQLPYLAMLKNNGHSIEWWLDGERCPSDSFKPKGFEVLSISDRGGFERAMTVLHRYEATDKTPARSILRHYARGQYATESLTTFLIIDIEAKIDVGVTQSLFPFLWLMPKGVRVASKCRAMWVDTFFDSSFAKYFPMEDFKGQGKKYEEIRDLENGVAKNGLITLVSDTLKAIRRLQTDLALFEIGRLNKLNEFSEVYPLLQRTALGRFLGALEVEPSPEDDEDANDDFVDLNANRD